MDVAEMTNLIAKAVAQGQSAPDISIVGAPGTHGSTGASGSAGNAGVNGGDAHCNWKTGCSSGSAGTVVSPKVC